MYLGYPELSEITEIRPTPCFSLCRLIQCGCNNDHRVHCYSVYVCDTVLGHCHASFLCYVQVLSCWHQIRIQVFLPVLCGQIGADI